VGVLSWPITNPQIQWRWIKVILGWTHLLIAIAS
jgi:hypothetical protein